MFDYSPSCGSVAYIRNVGFLVLQEVGRGLASMSYYYHQAISLAWHGRDAANIRHTVSPSVNLCTGESIIARLQPISGHLKCSVCVCVF